MPTNATDLEWNFEPPDFFEEKCTVQLESGTVGVERSKAILRLAKPVDPITRETRDRLHAEVVAVFEVRQLLIHRAYTIRGPNVVQHQEDGRRNIFVALEGVEAKATCGSVDFRITNSAGEVIADTKADRLRVQEAFVSELAPKAARSLLLASLLRSYGAAVADPSDELVHLYEIRDALAAHYKNEASAQAALQLTKKEWERLGRLANEEPLLQGRHRGRDPQRRAATEEELASARGAAMLLIRRFAETVR